MKKLHLNHVEKYDAAPAQFEGLTYALRTDARHATALLKQNILNHFSAAADPEMAQSVKKTVHMAYRNWGHDVLEAMAENLDYSRYDIHDKKDKFLNAHFYNAGTLAKDAIQKGEWLVRKKHPDSNSSVFYISLDDMIEQQTPHWGVISFSRLFSATGTQHMGYRARPGTKPLDEQFKDVRDKLKSLQEINGYKMPIVLLEDNVRHARMLNWVIDLMDRHNIFEHGDLVGISTCFCCANEEERKAIKYRGETLPLASVVDYKDAKIDVVTPRDLIFDGFVVETPSGVGRLPGIFMDVAKLFKIKPGNENAFRSTVHCTSVKFCETLEREFNMRIPLKWSTGAEAISHITGYSPDTPLTHVLNSMNNNHRRDEVLLQRAVS